jgi:hypothetical protein
MQSGWLATQAQKLANDIVGRSSAIIIVPTLTLQRRKKTGRRRRPAFDELFLTTS